MDALRYSKKISLLAVAIIFLFTFFNLILDAPRTLASLTTTAVHCTGSSRHCLARDSRRAQVHEQNPQARKPVLYLIIPPLLGERL